MLSLTWINVIGTRWAARTQNITTVIKVGFLLVLMLGPLLFGKWNAANLQPIAPPEISLDFFKAFGLAMVAVFWPYDGWINIGPVAEEVREPQRNVPLGLGLGVPKLALEQLSGLCQKQRIEADFQEARIALNIFQTRPERSCNCDRTKAIRWSFRETLGPGETWSSKVAACARAASGTKGDGTTASACEGSRRTGTGVDAGASGQ